MKEKQCPNCKSPLIIGASRIECSKRDYRNPTQSKCWFNFSTTICKHKLTEEEQNQIIDKNETTNFIKFTNNQGTDFDAKLTVMKDQQKVGFSYPNRGPSVPMKNTTLTCPACKKGKIQESNKTFRCQFNTMNNKQCEFVIYKDTSKHQVTLEEVETLITTGTTSTITDFINNKEGNSYSAKLSLNEEFKVVMIYEKQPSKSPQKTEKEQNQPEADQDQEV